MKIFKLTTLHKYKILLIQKNRSWKYEWNNNYNLGNNRNNCHYRHNNGQIAL